MIFQSQSMYRIILRCFIRNPDIDFWVWAEMGKFVYKLQLMCIYIYIQGGAPQVISWFIIPWQLVRYIYHKSKREI